MNYQTIIFDLDSTLVTIEGLDWLAQQKGVGEEVKTFTDASMNGQMDFRQAFIQKNDILKASQSELERLGKEYINSYTQGAQQTIQALQQAHKNIYIITGNFMPSALIVADDLGIPHDHIFANRINFDEQGNYRSLDTEYPLTHSDGKSQIIAQLKATNPNLGPIAFIGDGSTDASAAHTVNLFIGFGGVAYRPNVEKLSHIYIKQPDLSNILPHILA